MKIVILIARLLLGLIFVVLGLNGFLNFLSMGPMPTGLAGQFIGALISVALLLGSCCGASHRRRAVARESFCTAGASAAWSGDCEHSSVSCVPESSRHWFGYRRRNPVADCLLRASSILLGDFCATQLSYAIIGDLILGRTSSMNKNHF